MWMPGCIYVTNDIRFSISMGDNKCIHHIILQEIGSNTDSLS
jgi:hypothetical protein